MSDTVSGTREQNLDQTSKQTEHDHTAINYVATSPDDPRKDHKFHQWEYAARQMKCCILLGARIFQIFFQKFCCSIPEEELG